MFPDLADNESGPEEYDRNHPLRSRKPNLTTSPSGEGA